MTVFRCVLGVTAVLALAGCATGADGPAGANGSPVSLEELAGVRVEGPVTLLPDKGGRCWGVTYDDGHSAVQAPLLAPVGYTDANISMADPMNPGSDYPGPAMMDADGNPVGFARSGAMIAATYQDAADPPIADAASHCGWDGLVLVADDPGGVFVDPDGLTGPARVCSGTGDQLPTAGEAAALLDDCV